MTRLADEQRPAQGSGSEDTPLSPGLYLVATPIGNLEDITLRALRVLRTVDRIACEDTRQTQKLLNHFGITTPTLSYHLHNEAGRAAELVAALISGARIAVVSDAGTPGIADPGGLVAAAAIAAGVTVFPIPGANAVVSAFSASGLAGTADQAGTFRFHGFLPAKEGPRRTALEELRSSSLENPGTTDIFYEVPHRILETLSEIEAIFGPGRHIVVARELTKLHEEFLRGTVSEVRAQLAGRGSVRGEMVLLFAPTTAADQPAPQTRTTSLAGDVNQAMKQDGISEMEALKRVAKARGIGKSQAYRELQRERSR